MSSLTNTKKNSDNEITVKCPHCQKLLIWNAQQTYRPFCSERCKLIDLGEWAAGEKTIPGESIDPEPNPDSDSFFH